jgi:hypothetical protein
VQGDGLEIDRTNSWRKTLSTKSKIALAAALILGTAPAALATHAFAANNYDSPDWAPIFTGPTVGREARVSVYKENAVRFIAAPSRQLSHKIYRPR